MSLLVTGVPTRKRANRKLKMRELAPRGATYSARMYSRARVLPSSWERLVGVSREGEKKSELHVENDAEQPEGSVAFVWTCMEGESRCVYMV